MARPFKQQRSPQHPPKRPLRPAPVVEVEGEDQLPAVPAGPTQRLHKLLAVAGLGSRREMEALIESGRVTINGQVATVGAAVSEYDVVRIDSRPIRLSFEAELPKVLVYHKPEGEIVSQEDPEGRASVFDKLPRVRGAKWISVGRLDMNTSGLLIFTTSGELANYFMHPRYEVEREYAVRIFGELTEGQMLQLTQGIELEDGPANFYVIYPQGGEGSNHWYQVILREGRNREVRRLFEALQLPVSRLMRVRFGPITLPSRLKRGMMLELSQKEVLALLEWAGLATPKMQPRQLTAREREKSGVAFTPKPGRAARERVAASERRRSERERDEERNAPKNEPRSTTRKAFGEVKSDKTRESRPEGARRPRSKTSPKTPSARKNAPRRRAQ